MGKFDTNVDIQPDLQLDLLVQKKEKNLWVSTT